MASRCSTTASRRTSVDTIGKGSVDTIGKDLDTIGTSVDTIGKDLNTIVTSVDTIGKGSVDTDTIRKGFDTDTVPKGFASYCAGRMVPEVDAVVRCQHGADLFSDRK